ncbi:MAG: hypothetical protein EL88_24460 [Phocaeicola dorei]|nr:MAG: hypothetical protein EL88_24460 [Phocaeicola dorei]OUP95905.1 hypothetical protein B5F00_02475 [Phocaeicola dorei]
MSKLWQAIRLNRALKGIKRLWNRIPDGLIAGTSPPLMHGWHRWYARCRMVLNNLPMGQCANMPIGCALFRMIIGILAHL